jgi:hypothetical protein
MMRRAAMYGLFTIWLIVVLAVSVRAGWDPAREQREKKSVIIVKAGASKDASYDDGVAVFTMPTSGLMAEATVGGQKFQYTPK